MATIYDQRGRPVPLFNLAARRNDLSDFTFSRVRQSLLRETMRGMGAPPPVTWLIALGLAVLAVVQGVRGEVGTTVAFGMLAFIAAVYGLTHPYMLPRASPEQVRDALLDNGLCASCAYEIWEVWPGPDGTRICPECGAAWNLSAGVQPPARPSRAFRLGRMLRRVMRPGRKR